MITPWIKPSLLCTASLIGRFYSLRHLVYSRNLTEVKPITESGAIFRPAEIRSVAELGPGGSYEYVSSPTSKLQSLKWTTSPENVLLVKKPHSQSTTRALVEFIEHIYAKYPSVNLIVPKDVAEEVAPLLQTPSNDNSVKPHVLYTGEHSDIARKANLMVTLGGDGTILHAVSMFRRFQVPPILSFSLGTLGFLLPFDFKEYESAFAQTFNSRAKCLHRTRLECDIVRKGDKRPITRYAMNDIFLHRGPSPHLANLDIFIDGVFLTRTTTDGLIFSTPTGSTAYSLSAGGSIISPIVACILLTPICPRSLSFRPLILPHSSHIVVRVEPRPNQGTPDSPITLSVDGISQEELHVGDEIHVVNEVGTIYIEGNKLSTPQRMTHRRGDERCFVDPATADGGAADVAGIHCVAKTENDWVQGINELLGFNSSFRSTARHEDNRV